MSRGAFWGSCLLAAGAVTIAAAWLFPYRAIGLVSEADRYRGWLLILWTTAVMAICFGAAGLLSIVTPIGFRDVADAGSVSAARELRRQLGGSVSSGLYSFSGWLVFMGVALLLIYFVAYLSNAS